MHIFQSYSTSTFSAMRFDENPFTYQCIFSSPIAHRLSMLCVLMKILLHTNAKKKNKKKKGLGGWGGGGGLKDFKFIGHFPVTSWQ